MSELQITVNDTITPKLNELLRGLRSADLMQNLGDAAAAIATRSFRDEALRPSPWAQRAASTPGKHPLLRLSTLLYRSIRVTEVDAGHVTIGSDRTYAGFHQFGTRKMPARPFMPFDAAGMPTPRVIQALEQRAAAWLRKMVQ